MSKKLGIHVNGRRYDVDIEDDFALFLEKEISKDFNMDGNNNIKKVLSAYVRKTYALYTQEKEIQKIYTTIS